MSAGYIWKDQKKKAGTELGLLRSYQFPSHVTSSDDSVGTGSMGSGFVWLDRSKFGSERVGREEEGTSSGRAEMGVYTVILRRIPDHEDRNNGQRVSCHR